MKDGIVGSPVGHQEIGRGWRWFFWAAAAFNFVIGLSSMIAPDLSVDNRIMGLMIFAFGVVYALVARDPARYGPVVWAGLMGKVGVVALFVPTIANGTAGLLLTLVIALDAIFALGFLAFLLTKQDDVTRPRV